MIFTYPLSFVTIVVLPLGYILIISYYLLTFNFTEVFYQLGQFVISYINNLGLFFYVPYRVVSDFFAVLFGLTMWVL